MCALSSPRLISGHAAWPRWTELYAYMSPCHLMKCGPISFHSFEIPFGLYMWFAWPLPLASFQHLSLFLLCMLSCLICLFICHLLYLLPFSCVPCVCVAYLFIILLFIIFIIISFIIYSPFIIPSQFSPRALVEWNCLKERETFCLDLPCGPFDCLACRRAHTQHGSLPCRLWQNSICLFS